MKKNTERPKRSLRTLLILWFLLLSIAPISFMTWYSLNKFEDAMLAETQQKFIFNKKEIINNLSKSYSDIKTKHEAHLSDNSLMFYLKTGSSVSLKELIRGWILSDQVNKISIFDTEHKLVLDSFISGSGEIEEHYNIENEPVYLSKEFVDSIGNKLNSYILTINDNKHIEFTAFSKIVGSNGDLVGYLKESLSLDRKDLTKLISSENDTKIIIFKEGQKSKLVSDIDLLNVPVNKWDKEQTHSLKDLEYTFKKIDIRWGDDWVSVFLGDSKKSYNAVLKNILTSFITVMSFVIVILIILSFIISMMLLKPLRKLLDVIKEKDPGEELISIPVETSTELGLLTEKFNELFRKVFNSQNKLKNNIENLEDVNTEIKDTQSKLVHSEKMASLGQLVAGVAHELNNPIGFIYSNMGHLREYATSLIKIIESTKEDSDEVLALKEKYDYDFIINDMPKLIQSCEDGAKRTRDIVLGLRNFSRIEEAKLKEVNLTEGIDRTLDLLKGQLKSKVTVDKKYAKAPLIMCYPSQLNQVFMNIIVNAIDAIEERGELNITTQLFENDKIQVLFKDSGAGMDEKTVEKIFDPFFTTKDIGKGTGLGLSISYGIIQKHNGEIQVNSKVGEGTEFIITLPINGPTDLKVS